MSVISKRQRWKILERDNFTCVYCGATAPEIPLHIDHKIPRVLGGDDDDDNLAVACEDCNAGKRDRPLPKKIGKQWKVTFDGIYCLDCDQYFISRDRVLETTVRGQNTFYDWPLHMSEKTWVDLDEFLAAFGIAVQYQHRNKFDPMIFAESIARARKQKRKSEEYNLKLREMFPEKFKQPFVVWSMKEMALWPDPSDFC